MVLVPESALAHNFKTIEGFPQLIDSIGAALNDPTALLTLLPLGVFASIWRQEGLLTAWPAAAIGMILGIGIAGFGTPWVVVPALLIGVVAALLGVIAADYPVRVVQAVAFAAGTLAMMVILEGHGFFELSPWIYAGLFLGCNAAVVIPAGIVRMMIEKLPASFSRIAARIVSSWAAAITLMLLAFDVQRLFVT